MGTQSARGGRGRIRHPEEPGELRQYGPLSYQSRRSFSMRPIRSAFDVLYQISVPYQISGMPAEKPRAVLWRGVGTFRLARRTTYEMFPTTPAWQGECQPTYGVAEPACTSLGCFRQLRGQRLIHQQLDVKSATTTAGRRGSAAVIAATRWRRRADGSRRPVRHPRKAESVRAPVPGRSSR